MAFEMARAGWVQRLSSILRRWKKTWLVLYQDGTLKYFESPDSHTAEGAYTLSTNCLAVYSSEQVLGDPPAGLGRTCMFSVILRDETTLTFCAEGPDDMRAWQVALEEARLMNQVTRAASAPPYSAPGTVPPVTSGAGYPGQVIAYPGPDGQMIYTSQPSNPTVVVNSTQVRATPAPVGMGAGLAVGMAAGAIAGAAVTRRHGYPAAHTTVMYTNDPIFMDDMQYGRYSRRRYWRQRGDNNDDLALGLVGGMALGSLMWGPLMWGPLMWGPGLW